MRQYLGLYCALMFAAVGGGCSESMQPDGDAGKTDAGGPPEADGGGSDAGDVSDGGHRDAHVVHPDSGPPPDGGHLILDRDAAEATYDAQCGPLGRARCTDAFSCGCVSAGSPPPDIDSCALTERFNCEAELGAIDEALGRDGIHTIDSAMVSACADTFAESYAQCMTPPDPTRLFACIHMMTSPIPIGSFCFNGGTLCADGAGICAVTGRCIAIPDTADMPCVDVCAGDLACVSGTCQPPLAEGSSCDDDEDCAAPHRCLTGRCGTLAGRGSPCTVAEECTVGLECRTTCVDRADPTCSVSLGDCGHDSQCTLTFESRCRPRHAAGELCGGGDCIDPFFCDFSLASPTCAPPPGRDESCDRTGVCDAGLVCTWIPDRFGQFCVEPMGFGGPCDSIPCGEGLACWDDLICRTPPGLGEPCASGICSPDTFCEFTPIGSVCSLRAHEGEDCSGRQCDPGLGCLFDPGGGSRCTLLPGPGERCDDFFDCRDMAICSFVDSAGTFICMPPAAPGEVCFGSCIAPDTFCGSDVDRGRCEPIVCGTLARGGIGFPDF